MPVHNTSKSEGVEVSVVQDVEDFAGLFDCSAKAFGDQIHDAVWIGLHPGWDTPKGQASGAARMAKRWQNVTKDAHGRPNTVFLKATVPDANDDDDDDNSSKSNSKRRIVGVAIWAQLSFTPGHGDAPSGEITDISALGYPDASEERFATQLFAGLMAKRLDVLRDKAATDSPAAFALDLCAVDPEFQRRGIAVKLVQWGLDEAERRGGLEATTEASVMGRHVYRKLGFEPVEELDYGVDEDLLKGRELPSNLFMRTRP
ncbi:unnamed protein product [Discula destructiva]